MRLINRNIKTKTAEGSEAVILSRWLYVLAWSRKMGIEKIVTDKQLEDTFGYSDFGKVSKRDVVKNSLLKYASGYATGYTAKCILEELRLITKKEKLTRKGMDYLWGAFSNGQSY